MALAMKQEGMFIPQKIYKLLAGLDLEKFWSAWKTTVGSDTPLWSRVIQTRLFGLVQIVLRRSQSSGWRLRGLKNTVELIGSDLSTLALHSFDTAFPVISNRITSSLCGQLTMPWLTAVRCDYFSSRSIKRIKAAEWMGLSSSIGLFLISRLSGQTAGTMENSQDYSIEKAWSNKLYSSWRI